MQVSQINSSLIQEKRHYLGILMDKYRAAYAAMGQELNAAQKPVHQENIKHIETEMEQIRSEIKALELPQRSPNENYRDLSRVWENELHRIDFSRAESTVKHIFKHLKRQEGSALLLMKKSSDMGGRWCVQKLKHRIREDLGNFVEPCDIGFLAHHAVSSTTFLTRLAEKYAPPEQLPTSSQALMVAIIDQIMGSLVSGNIFLLHVDIHTLAAKDGFLEWFVTEFWRRLIGKLSVISQQKRKIRLIAVLSIQGSIPKACLSDEMCCKKTTFDGGKILDLPLQNWKEKDICNWLFDYSGLTRQPNSLRDEEIEQMASNIYGATGGSPIKVYHSLMETMTQIVS